MGVFVFSDSCIYVFAYDMMCTCRVCGCQGECLCVRGSGTVF